VIPIACLTMLLRKEIVLPQKIQVPTHPFREGWRTVQSDDLNWIKGQLRIAGWNLNLAPEEITGSGIGQTSEAAITRALTLALRKVSEPCDGAKIARIQTVDYTWFTLARVCISPCKLQSSASTPGLRAQLALTPHKAPTLAITAV